MPARDFNPTIAALDVFGLRRVVLWLHQRTKRTIGSGDGGCPPVFGVEPLLRALSPRYQLGVVTSRQRSQVEAFLARMGTRDLFGALVSLESTRRQKPSPEPMRMAARLLGVPVDHCLMVGDAGVDVAAARQAGAQSVGVLCGIGSLKDLRQVALILASTADLAVHLL